MNPYLPPVADVAVERAMPEVPPEVQKKIKQAWIAGAISGSMTLLFTLLAISGTKAAGFNAWNFIDVVLIFGLAFGIYKKSRACAVLMLVYFVVSKILIAIETGSVSGTVLAIIFIYYYAQGIAGTFAYHKLVKQ
ncbi:hypothetical protein GTP41_12520 [Pseudoduganella sp. DS3]|uniref:Uncharacterized protein n=1 Tax=Pseudoduganella guangdongensis TaxID=2692179 RepID=A0A6N9HJF3_9BURK|nr:hypothetical protein [Pseudoduganella guangdongensis]MYN02925.1 hypothetical protein [Pseudoduganella guangdongensis]